MLRRLVFLLAAMLSAPLCARAVSDAAGAAAVPEPSALFLYVAGVAAVLVLKRLFGNTRPPDGK